MATQADELFYEMMLIHQPSTQYDEQQQNATGALVTFYPQPLALLLPQG